MPQQVAAPNLANTARIDSLMHEGKLYLSLNDAIALALENNLDIAIARYNLNIADTDVLRAKAGAQILGVNLGVVQNTPGGGVGGIGTQVGTGTGGTSLGAGGAGAGAGGIVARRLADSSALQLPASTRSSRAHSKAITHSSSLPVVSGKPLAEHVLGEFRLPAGLPLGHQPECWFQQQPHHRQQPILDAKSGAELQASSSS